MFNKLDLEQEQQEESIPVASEHGTNRHSSSDKKNISELEITKTGGTSRAYRISVLKRDAPDIAEKVIA